MLEINQYANRNCKNVYSSEIGNVVQYKPGPIQQISS